jgi:hypothetical protein
VIHHIQGDDEIELSEALKGTQILKINGLEHDWKRSIFSQFECISHEVRLRYEIDARELPGALSDGDIPINANDFPGSKPG